MCLPLPEGISDVTAAGIANPAMSSLVALTARTKFVAGESVLILGATGVAGQLAIQVAKRLGARRVIAAGRNPQALEKLKDLGADATISLDQEHTALVAAFRREWAESGVDVVLDYLWGHPAESLLEAISQRACATHHREFGLYRSEKARVVRSHSRQPRCAVRGSNFWEAASEARPLEQILQALAEFFKAAVQAAAAIHNKNRAPARCRTLCETSPEQGVPAGFSSPDAPPPPPLSGPPYFFAAYVLLNLLRVLVTVKLPSASADTLI